MKKDFGEYGYYSYKFPESVLSEAAINIVDIMHSVMEEAIQATTRCSIVLYSTARDVANLYRAIIPFMQADNLKTVARIRWIYYNDCMYISHQLAMIGPLYRER